MKILVYVGNGDLCFEKNLCLRLLHLFFLGVGNRSARDEIASAGIQKTDA